VSNGAETAVISNDEGAGTYLGARGAKRVVHATDGVGSQSDASSGHWDVPSIGTDAITAANVPEIVSIPRKREKPPDSPMETARRRPDEPNGCGSCADGSSACTVLETRWKRLQTERKPSECVKSARGCKTHLMGAKSRCPSVSYDGEESAKAVWTCTYH